MSSDRAEFDPKEIARASFPTAFRGYETEAVRHYLSRLAADVARAQHHGLLGSFERDEAQALNDSAAQEHIVELEREAVALQDRVEELEEALLAVPEPDESPGTQNLDEAELIELLGQETAQIYVAARAAANEIKQRAEGEAQELREQADRDARATLREADGCLEAARMEADEVLATANAEAKKAQARTKADSRRSREQASVKAEKAMAEATAKAEEDLTSARQRSAQIISDAELMREEILGDLVRRRRTNREQLDRLMLARDRLAQSLVSARGELDDISSDLQLATSSVVDLDTDGDSARPGYGRAESDEVSDLVRQLQISGDRVTSNGSDATTSSAPPAGSMLDVSTTASPFSDLPVIDGEAGLGPIDGDALSYGDPQSSERLDSFSNGFARRRDDEPEEAGRPGSQLPDASQDPTSQDLASRDDELPNGPVGNDGVADVAATEVLPELPGPPSGTGGADDVAPAIAEAFGVEVGVDGSVFERTSLDGTAFDLAGFENLFAGDQLAPEGDGSNSPEQLAPQSPGAANGHGEFLDPLPPPDDAASSFGQGHVAAGTDDSGIGLAAGTDQRLHESETGDRLLDQLGFSANSLLGSESASMRRSNSRGDLPRNAPYVGKLPVSFEARDVALSRSTPGFRRRLKRAVNDDQSDVLDRLRAGRGPLSIDELPRVDDQLERYTQALRPVLLDVVKSGGELLSCTHLPVAAGDNLSLQLAKHIVDCLRLPTLDAIEDGAASDREAILDPVRAIYRDFRNNLLPDLIDDALHEAFALGLFYAIDPDALVIWVADPRLDPDPICEENSTRAAKAKGEDFPSGHARPLSMPGCRCLALPAG